MHWLKATKVLQIAAVAATIASVLVGFQVPGSLLLLLLLLLVMSIMFPTIFSLAMEGIMPSERPLGSSYIIMTIVGGALIPPLMGKVSDLFGLSAAYLIPSICFVIVFLFSLKNNEVHG
jgi:FHS family L-fucose permease-like MFS transporter